MTAIAKTCGAKSREMSMKTSLVPGGNRLTQIASGKKRKSDTSGKLTGYTNVMVPAAHVEKFGFGLKGRNTRMEKFYQWAIVSMPIVTTVEMNNSEN